MFGVIRRSTLLTSVVLLFAVSVPEMAEGQSFAIASTPRVGTSVLAVDDPPPQDEDPELAAALERWWAKKKKAMLGGDFDMTFGAAIRVRAESRDPYSYSVANSRGADDFTLLRTKVHVGLKANKHLSGFIQFRDSRTFGDESPNSVLSDTEGVDLHQGYIALTNVHELAGLETPEGTVFLVRAGRIAFPSLGDQRMFSVLDWSNIGRTFDGYHLGVTSPNIDTHVVIATVNEGTSRTRAGRDAHLYVVYVATRPAEGFECDLYSAWRNYKIDGQTGEDGFAGDLEDQTYGGRLAFGDSGFRASLEGALQRGKSANDDVNAYGWAAEVGYRCEDVNMRPGVTVGCTYATGDGNPTDGNKNTFDPIAPFGHVYQGHYDQFAWKNGYDYYVKTVVQCCEPVSFHTDYHHFKLDEHEDAWYAASGAALRRDATGMSGLTVGNELDVYLKTTVSKNLKVWTGWSHFWRSTYVKKSGGGDNGNFFFFQGELLFGHKG